MWCVTCRHENQIGMLIVGFEETRVRETMRIASYVVHFGVHFTKTAAIMEKIERSTCGVALLK